MLDNTDVHDEIVPKNLTTAHGGFYVNYGPLGTSHILRKHFFRGWGGGSKWHFLLTFSTVFTLKYGDRIKRLQFVFTLKKHIFF